MTLAIPPRSDGELSFVLRDTQTGAVVTGATVVATVYDPAGHEVGTDVGASEVSGTYTIAILPDWSEDDAGDSVLGEFTVDALITGSGIQRLARLHYVVTYEVDD